MQAGEEAPPLIDTKYLIISSADEIKAEKKMEALTTGLE